MQDGKWAEKEEEGEESRTESQQRVHMCGPAYSPCTRSLEKGGFCIDLLVALHDAD